MSSDAPIQRQVSLKNKEGYPSLHPPHLTWILPKNEQKRVRLCAEGMGVLREPEKGGVYCIDWTQQAPASTFRNRIYTRLSEGGLSPYGILKKLKEDPSPSTKQRRKAYPKGRDLPEWIDWTRLEATTQLYRGFSGRNSFAATLYGGGTDTDETPLDTISSNQEGKKTETQCLCGAGLPLPDQEVHQLFEEQLKERLQLVRLGDPRAAKTEAEPEAFLLFRTPLMSFSLQWLSRETESSKLNRLFSSAIDGSNNSTARNATCITAGIGLFSSFSLGRRALVKALDSPIGFFVLSSLFFVTTADSSLTKF
ncbi:hypothetical protein EMPG_11081 [Blastomyces silverae]|uniref:Uncharacterized protein n=1 Tax=Blastomyces silverae TaxID=2060906 RepID=A0A0H1B253_9EURO|nr:hypothetical protein EMPG_11081 [Blastomyces silverae]